MPTWLLRPPGIPGCESHEKHRLDYQNGNDFYPNGSSIVKPDEKLTLGWREWVGLPELGLDAIKAKVDTGARTSTLHAFELDTFSEHGKARVRFKIHPIQKDSDTVVTCMADVVDERYVTDSGGHKEQRLIIETLLTIGCWSWPIEMTLTARDNMMFRRLLGRTALKGVARVDPSRSYTTGKKRRIKLKKEC